MNSKIVNAEKRIILGCEKLGVTDSGRKWLELVSDPFKDLPMPPEGYPDQCMAPSVCQVIKRIYQIDKGALAGSFDVNIFWDNVPIQYSLAETEVSGNQYAQAGQVAGNARRGGLVIRRGDTGTPLTHVDSITTDLDVLDLYENTDTRLIAVGFEVHNTTNKLSVGGAVTVWRNGKLDDEVDGVATLILDHVGDTVCIPCSVAELKLDNPPEEIADAMKLAGSKTWDAKDGVYIVPVMQSSENKPQSLSYYQMVSYDDDGTVFSNPITKTGTQNLIRTPACLNTKTPFAQQGAFFTGLPNASTLAVNIVMVFERFADDLNTDIASLSRPSPPYDFQAIKLYTEIAREMPPGVKVNMNGFGDWISGIASVIGKVAGVVSMVPGPIGAISRGVSAVANLITGDETIVPESKAIVPAPVKIVETITPKQTIVQETIKTTKPKKKKNKNKNKQQTIRRIEQTMNPKNNSRKQRRNAGRAMQSVFNAATNNSNQYSSWVPRNNYTQTYPNFNYQQPSFPTNRFY